MTAKCYGGWTDSDVAEPGTAIPASRQFGARFQFDQVKGLEPEKGEATSHEVQNRCRLPLDSGRGERI